MSAPEKYTLDRVLEIVRTHACGGPRVKDWRNS